MTKYNSIITGDAWFDWCVEPENPEEWDECPHCDSKPRIWVFDNGRFAECRCAIDYSLYDKRRVEAESVGEHLRRTGGSLTDYDNDGLRKAWNSYVGGERCE